MAMIVEGLDSGPRQAKLPSLAECTMQRASGGCIAAGQHNKERLSIVRHWGIPDADQPLKNEVVGEGSHW
jgi:hypothetical protein